MHYMTVPDSNAWEANVAVIATDGTPLGYFVWQSERPGRAHPTDCPIGGLREPDRRGH